MLTCMQFNSLAAWHASSQLSCGLTSHRNILAPGLTATRSRRHACAAVSTERASLQQQTDTDEEFRTNLRRRSLEANYKAHPSADGDFIAEGCSAPVRCILPAQSLRVPNFQFIFKTLRLGALLRTATCTFWLCSDYCDDVGISVRLAGVC